MAKIKFLAGYKTYIAATLIFLLAIYQIWATGGIDADILMKLFAALGLTGLRSAL